MYWDPSNEFFRVPFVDLPITWYGLLFATGFWLGFHIFTYMIKKSFPNRKQEEIVVFAERLLLYMVVATVLGARLGHILFYEHPVEYLKDPISIFKTWEGGLASHGGVLAIVIALYVFSRRVRKEWPEFTFWRLLDYIAVPAMFIGTMIRIGNFFNQEILGAFTDKPWAITFGHPADGSLAIPRHPAQLYEALFYFILFLFLFALWYRKGSQMVSGRIAGITLVAAFFFRFCIEFVKTEQSVWFEGELFLMGQILSLPIILLGLYLLFGPVEKARKNKSISL